jgi:hypothetical protein
MVVLAAEDPNLKRTNDPLDVAQRAVGLMRRGRIGCTM